MKWSLSFSYHRENSDASLLTNGLSIIYNLFNDLFFELKTGYDFFYQLLIPWMYTSLLDLVYDF